MSESQVTYDDGLFRQELQVFLAAIKKKDFRTGNIIANRIMTNSWISDEQYYGIIGFFLRELVIVGLNATNIDKETAINTVIDQIILFTDNIIGQISSNEKNMSKLWTYFTVAISKGQVVILPEDEKNNYSFNLKYTTVVFNRIFKTFAQQKEDLTYPTNYLIKGVLNELLRITRTYGIIKDDLYILSLLKMIDLIDEYVGVTSVSESDFKERINKEVVPKIDRFFTAIEKKDENFVNDFLWDMIKEWRLYYLRFLEFRRQVKKKLKDQPVMDEQTKSELVDELAEGLEKEIGNK